MLWRYDGANLTQVVITPKGSSYVDELTVVDDKTLYFVVNDGMDNELWKFDGTTLTKIDLNPQGPSNPSLLTVAGNDLYFRTDFGDTGWGLWQYDGSRATQIELGPHDSFFTPYNFTAVGNTLYFSANDGTYPVENRELWRYDGFALTKIDINSQGSSNPNELTAVGSTLYFRADDGTGNELWQYAGATLTKIDINPAGNSWPFALTAVGNVVYFRADDGTDAELWRYDGAQLTELDVNPQGSSFPADLTAVGNVLYFNVGSDSNLWRYDGATLTNFDINPTGNANLQPSYAAGSTLYFSANDGIHGQELWALRPAADKALITIALDQQPNSPANVRFTGSLGTFKLDDSTADDGDTVLSSRTFTVDKGSYTFKENVALDKVAVEVVCTPYGKATVNGATATVKVDVGDGVTCIFVTQQRSSVWGFVYHDRKQLGRFNQGDSPLQGWRVTLYDDHDTQVASKITNRQGKVNFAGLAPGRYTVCEELQNGWSNTQPSTTDPTYSQPCYTAVLRPDIGMEARFGNYQGVISASELVPEQGPLFTELSAGMSEAEAELGDMAPAVEAEDAWLTLEPIPADEQNTEKVEYTHQVYLPVVSR